MLIVADKQILCGSCGALVGLRLTGFIAAAHPSAPIVVMKDPFVVSSHGINPVFFCNSTCKERAQV